jgi:hypothetical protein
MGEEEAPGVASISPATDRRASSKGVPSPGTRQEMGQVVVMEAPVALRRASLTEMADRVPTAELVALVAVCVQTADHSSW